MSFMVEKLMKLKREKKAVILAHNYQSPEVQDSADYVGDSIELCLKAKNEKDAEIILFAAVDFMAESAAILNPEKKVLLPSLGARCPMAQMLTVEEIRRWKKKYPKAPVVLYVNTLAEAKAECDVCCTSANAVKIVESFDADTIIFGPDRNLAEYVMEKTRKNIIAIPSRGFCPTHLLFQPEDIQVLKEKYADAAVTVHPECSREVRALADFVGSTSQMCQYAKNSKFKRYIIATEVGLIHRLEKENPRKAFIPAYDAVCPNMKLNNLERLCYALENERYVVRVPERTAERARRALEKMFAISERVKRV